MTTDESIQSQGGKARAQSLSDEQKKEIALKGALARWGDRTSQVSHKGNFITEFGVDIDCYVLNDSKKTAVISQRGIGRAIGLSSTGGAKLPRFLASKTISQYVAPELGKKLSNPLRFQWESPGPEQPPGIIYGYDVSLLIDICQIIIRAKSDGNLEKRHDNIVKQASIILSASAKTGITQLVYALAGYNPTTTEVISAFKAFVQEEARKYEKEFPPDLYQQWQRLYNIEVPTHGKPWNFKHLTVRHIYYPLAKSNGRILQLMKALKANGGDRRKKLFQFLNELGTRALRIHMGRVLEMAESSPNSITYEQKIAKRFGGQQELELVLEPR